MLYVVYSRRTLQQDFFSRSLLEPPEAARAEIEAKTFGQYRFVFTPAEFIAYKQQYGLLGEIPLQPEERY